MCEAPTHSCDSLLDRFQSSADSAAPESTISQRASPSQLRTGAPSPRLPEIAHYGPGPLVRAGRALRRRRRRGRHCDVHGTLSRSTILLQTAGRNQLQTNGSGALVQASQYLRHVSTTEGLRSFWKGNGVSILQKMATTGSNYFVYERLKEALRFCWASSDDVGFKARLLCGTLAGAINVTVAYPLDLIRTNIASSHEAAARGSEWAGIVETASLLYKAHGLGGFMRGPPGDAALPGCEYRPPLRHLRDAEHEPIL